MGPLFITPGVNSVLNGFLSTTDIANCQGVNPIIKTAVDNYYKTEPGKDKYQEKEYNLKKFNQYLKGMGGDLASFNRWKNYKREMQEMDITGCSSISIIVSTVLYYFFKMKPEEPQFEPIFSKYNKYSRELNNFLAPNKRI